MRLPVCAYCRSVDAFAWGVVGSVAGVAAVIVAIVFGIIPLVQGRKARLAPADAAARAEVPASQDVQAGPRDVQVKQYIQTYIERQDLAAVSALGRPPGTGAPPRPGSTSAQSSSRRAQAVSHGGLFPHRAVVQLTVAACRLPSRRRFVMASPAHTPAPTCTDSTPVENGQEQDRTHLARPRTALDDRRAGPEILAEPLNRPAARCVFRNG